MNDNENIKALENLHNRILNDASFLAKVNHGELSALFHIKRILECQDAELERLQSKVKKLGKEQYDLCSQIVNLKDDVKYSKSEAITEFWKRFDKVLCENIGPSKRVYWKISSDGDNLIKEMTEGN